MHRLSYRAAAAAMLLATASAAVAAQNQCTGAGTPFGVVSYQCGECSVTQKYGQRTTWSFQTEPTITRVDAGSPFEPGDVLAAVNDRPITTAEGAEAFTHPATGRSSFTVRRGGRTVALSAEVNNGCVLIARIVDSARVLLSHIQDSSRARASYRGMIGDTLQLRDRGGFGFAIACSQCTGQMLMSFETNPVIAELDADGAAKRAGLEVGDVIVAVDGQSVLQPEGAHALMSASHAATLRLTVRRSDGRTLTVEMKAAPPNRGDDRRPANGGSLDADG